MWKTAHNSHHGELCIFVAFPNCYRPQIVLKHEPFLCGDYTLKTDQVRVMSEIEVL